MIVECMYAGELETLTPPRNPLDILAQQTVATVSMDPVHVDDWYALVRRASPWKDLPEARLTPRWICWRDAIPLAISRYSDRELSGIVKPGY